MKELPVGKSLGWMQAPASWIRSHTVRFIGVVRVVIQDGEGYILIKKGKPLFHYFKHGTIELRGHTAQDYFNSHPVIEFNLCKYTPEEFARALKICNIEDEPAVPKEPAVSGPGTMDPKPPSPLAGAPDAKPAGERTVPVMTMVTPHVHMVEERPAVSGPVQGEQKPPSRPAVIPDIKPVGERNVPGPAVVSSPSYTFEERPAVPGPVSDEQKPSSRPAVTPIPKPGKDNRIPDPVVISPQVHTVAKRAVKPQPVVADEPDVTILSQIRDLNGIVALAVFNEKRTVIMMGDEDSEVLVKTARTMLETAKKITPRLKWGLFVHLTIQVPAGNMIIAPYRDNYLCMLTTRVINIGHIRRILRDLQQKEAPPCVS